MTFETERIYHILKNALNFDINLRSNIISGAKL